MKLKNIALAIAAIFTFAAQAQQMPEFTDSALRTGQLPNGLTYYVRHNELPKGQANFHIAQKVGAVQEEENQNGLAHFLEHMCFNGTKNFPDKALSTWLESIGVKFGYNLNAHTSTDETVYDITNVPVSRESIIDSCLLILHDWADALTLSDEEINKERGVIHEEWRLGSGAVSRILNRHAPELYPGTKYATHDVIGSMDVIDNFEPQVLRDYYEKWYRPDLQAIIVVGDIDVDAVEAKIKEIFSPITMPENPAPFTYQQVPDNNRPLIISDKDAEMPFNLIFIAQKYDMLPPRELRNTPASLAREYLDEITLIMLNNRLNDIALQPDAPFAGCNAGMGPFLYANTKGALMLQAMVNDKGSLAAEKAALTELLRVKRHGFTTGEYNRARDEYMSRFEKKYENRNSEKSAEHAQKYIQHFIENEPLADTETAYNFMKQLAAMIPVDLLNETVKSLFIPAGTDSGIADSEYPDLGYNLVIFSLAPDKDGVEVPDAEAFGQVLDQVNGSPVEAYVDNVVTEPLLAQLPEKGKVVKTKENKTLGYTVLTLSNGAKVILKPTDFKDNEILLKATSKGGAALYPAEDVANTSVGPSIIESCGIAQFSTSDLQKLLSGVQASVTPAINHFDETISARSTVKDLETMMQLLYLTFTAPREDETSFNVIKGMYSSQLENMGNQPQFVFSDSLTRALYGHHPKARTITKELVDKADYARSLQIYKERFANAADFTFIITGSFEPETMIALVEQYIASLPAKGKPEKRMDDGQHIVKGTVRNEFIFPNESEQAYMAMIWTADMPYTLENIIKANVAGQIMSNGLLNSVREDEGAAYSPMSMGKAQRGVKDGVIIQTAFGLNPDKHAKSAELTIAALENLAKEVPAAELSKMQEYMIKNADENAKENSYWLRVIENNEVEGVDIETRYRNIVKSLTPKDIQDFVKAMLAQGNRFEMLMLPK